MGSECYYLIEKSDKVTDIIQFYLETIHLSSKFDHYYIYFSSRNLEQAKEAQLFLQPFIEKNGYEPKIFSIKNQENEWSYDWDGTIRDRIDILPLIKIFNNQGYLGITHSIEDVLDPLLNDLRGCDIAFRISGGNRKVELSFRKKLLTTAEIKLIEDLFKIQLKFIDCS